MGLLDILEEFTEADIDRLVEAVTFGEVSPEFEEELIDAIQDADPTLREDLVAEMPAFARLEEALPGVERSQPPEGPLPGEPVPEEPEETIRRRTQAEREARQRIIDLIDANREDVEVLFDIARALEQREAAISGLFSQERLETLIEPDVQELADRAREAARQAEPLEVGDFPDLERALRRGAGRDATYFENVIAELRGERDVRTLANQGVPAEEVQTIREEQPQVIDAAVDRAREALRGLRGEPVERERPAPAEIRREQLAEPRPAPGEVIREDTSRISDEPITRDVGLELTFLSFIDDVGRCRQFDCRNRDNYFRLTAGEQRRFYDFTVEEALQWLVNRGDTTVSQLRQRGFPDDVIPD